MLSPVESVLPVQEARKGQIHQLEQEMRAMPQIELETQHTFGPGFYARTISIPAGSTLTGKVHATEHLFILSQGEMLVATEDGMQHIRAPFQSVCRPGLKRAGHALTDAVCTNVHITTETSLDRLEAELICSEALEAPQETVWLG